MRKKKIQIPDINTGLRNADLVVRVIGRRDYAAGMLLDHPDGGTTTPWLNQKGKLYEAYVNHLFHQEAAALAPIHEETAALQEELRRLGGTPSSRIEEEAVRQAAAQSARINAIQHRLAQLQAKTESMQLQFNWLLGESNAVFTAKTAAYWRGVVQASNEPIAAAPAAVSQVPDIDRLYAPMLMLMKEV
jgi:hypothetical protein